MIFPSIDQLFVWVIWGISSLPNIAEGVRDYKDSIESVKNVFVVQTQKFGSLSSPLLASDDAREMQVPMLHHEIAISSNQYLIDSRWWDEWLNQSGTSDKRNLKLNSSLTLSAKSKRDPGDSDKPPFKAAGYNRPKKADDKASAHSAQQAVHYRILQASRWYGLTTRTIGISIGKASSPWVRSMEFVEVESRTYPEFYLHNERVKASRMVWQQQVRKFKEFTYQWVPFTEKIRKVIEATANLKSCCSNLLQPILAHLRINP